MTDDRQTPERPHPSNQSHAPGPKPANLISRRQVLTAGAASAVGLLVLPQAARGGSGKGQMLLAQANPDCCTVAPTDCSSPTLTPPSDSSFPFPELLTSSNDCDTSENAFRTLSENLDLIEEENTPTEGVYTRRLEIRGTGEPLLPGPTLCVYPGDRIAFNLRNDLSANGADTYCPNPLPDELKNRPHCFNTTNIHFHGLHVSPLSLDADGQPVEDPNDNEAKKTSSDDVLFALDPQTSHDWCVQLPDFHAPGTHWYHAHVHGTTALDVSNGAVGALIVQEPPGQEILAGAPDVLMVIQEILPTISCNTIFGNAGASDEPCEQNPPPISAQQSQDRGVYEQQGSFGGGPSGTFLVNGQETPTLTIKKGEVQRWRLINATGTPRGFMVIEVVKTDTENPQTLYCVAIDGITLYGKSMTDTAVRVTSHELSPGNRVDFLVNLPQGTYELRKKAFPGVFASQDGLLARITVTAEDYDDGSLEEAFNNLQTLPETPPCYLQPLTSSDTVNYSKQVVFQASGDFPEDLVTTPGRGDFKISGKKFGEEGAEVTVPLGTTQDWILANVSGATHPFHIHVNPFQIIEIGEVEQDTDGNYLYNPDIPTCENNPQINWTEQVDEDRRIWWDTIAVKPGEALKIRHRFFDYWGTFVLHCHVLIHEDQGMMWEVNIANTNDKGIDPCETLATCVTDYGEIPDPGEPVPCVEPTSSQTQTTPTQKQKQKGRGRGPGSGRGRGSGGGRGPGSGKGRGGRDGME